MSSIGPDLTSLFSRHVLPVLQRLKHEAEGAKDAQALAVAEAVRVAKLVIAHVLPLIQQLLFSVLQRQEREAEAAERAELPGH